MTSVVVIDACGGNLASIVYALRRAGGEPVITSDPEKVQFASRVILPGVGTARDSMERLQGSGLVPVLKMLTVPLLGVCVGMQLLFESSAEGETDTLGLLPGRVTRLLERPSARIPHMGWNQVYSAKKSRLLSGIPEGTAYYFVHSFRAPDGDFVAAFTDHGERIPALIEQGNVYGIQCHPEKSQAAGTQFLRNFLSL